MIKNILVLFSLLFITFHDVQAQVEWNEEKEQKVTALCEKYLTKNLIIFKEDKVVFEYGDLNEPLKVFSVRKSLVSLMFGIYAEAGKIDVTKTLEELEIDDLQKLTKAEKQATVLDLLKAKSGVYHPAAFETPGMMNRRPERGSHKPGEFYFYNNWDFNALTTIFENETGVSIFEAFNQKIAKPLGFEDFNLENQEYILEEEKSIHKATFWSISARDLFKLGVVLLNKGKHNDKVIIPEKWLEKSIQPYSNLGILGGWGLCWWVAINQQHFPFVNLPDGTFSARGTGQQTLLVIPEYKMVITHNTEVNSPKDKMMKVTDFGRLLKAVMD